MKRCISLCVLSALIGALVARVWLDGRLPWVSGATSAQAVEPVVTQGPALWPAPPASTGDAPVTTVGAPVAAAGAPVAAAGAPIPVPATDNLAALTPEERVNVAVYERVNRSVVNINTRMAKGDRFNIFEISSEGAGSGSVLDQQGHILTNFHVVEDAKEIQVMLFDGHSYPARVVGQDPATDIAVIRIEAPPESLIPVTLGDSTHLRVGQRVFAIGNPFGLERTLTIGIVSSLNRTIESPSKRKIRSIIQTDAAINPGSSGGPLLDSQGQLIGMNTAIASNTGQSAGVGFAIPSSAIRRIVPQLIQRGKVIRPDAGIVRVLETETGIVIATMSKGGPAEQAGLRGFGLKTQRRRQGPFVFEQTSVDRSTADRIVAVNGQPVTRAEQLLDHIESHRPGENVVLTIEREGRQLNVNVRLGAGE